VLESYIKLPNITTSKLQEVVDYLDENNIEYIEEYKRDEEIERLNSIIKEVREYIKENTTSYYTDLEHTNEEFELIGDPKELLEILDKVNI
jgi:arsenate reductase-like glutaredoxin family protein